MLKKKRQQIQGVGLHASDPRLERLKQEDCELEDSLRTYSEFKASLCQTKTCLKNKQKLRFPKISRLLIYYKISLYIYVWLFEIAWIVSSIFRFILQKSLSLTLRNPFLCYLWKFISVADCLLTITDPSPV
jgi:hypothetical protein